MMIATKWYVTLGMVLAVINCGTGWCAGQDADAASAGARNSQPLPASTPSGQPAEMTADGYKLVWHDEFNKDGPLNLADWGYENGFVRNQELQWYQPENAVCKDGYLVIEARKESKPNPRYVAPGSSCGNGRGGRAW
jgi:hypothetical protein